jgi:hypothetical protein
MHVCCGGGSDALAALAIGVCAVTCLTDLGSIRLLLWHTSLSSLCLRDRIRRYLTDVISLPINFSCNYRLFITHDLKLLVFVSLYAKTHDIFVAARIALPFQLMTFRSET